MGIGFGIEEWSISRLSAYEKNPRKNDHAVQAVAKAIDAFGFRVPLLVRSSGEIIDGHLRLKAAIHLNLETVPVIVADDMTDAQVKAFRISVNKVAELAKWDISLLEEELQSIQALDVDISAIGFSEVELNGLLGDIQRDGNEDKVPERTSQPVARFGDLWRLGNHRLYVGDSTVKQSYQRLLGDDYGHVDMCWTDPPYNVDYQGKAGKIKNDKMSEKEFLRFLSGFYQETFAALKCGAGIYVAHADGKPSYAFRNCFADAGFYYSTCLIWKKNNSTIGRSDYHYQHEPILYGWKPGERHKWYGGRKRKTILDVGDDETFSHLDDGSILVKSGNDIVRISGEQLEVEYLAPSIIEIDKPMKSELHPTMKPVSLVEYFLINSSQDGEVVLDCFGGSGTTIIAAEKIGRRSAVMELDQIYADVCIRRWQEYTGRHAEHDSGMSYCEMMAERI